MKTTIKTALKGFIDLVVTLIGKTAVGRYFYGQIISNAMGRTQKVVHHGVCLIFSTPNALNKFRVDTFSTKEPETLEWLDNIPQGSVVWDIGANVGLYSCYAAKARSCRVWAFEPSVFNLELLARNIAQNKLADLVCIVPLALSDELGANQLRLTSTDWGGALSTFGQNFGWDGKTIQQVFGFQTLGLSMEDAMQRLAISRPDYIKMDVDGIEHLILKGGTGVLNGLKGILIEVNDDFHEQADQCQSLLTKAGLVLKEKRHSEMIATSASGFHNTYNQIWVRP